MTLTNNTQRIEELAGAVTILADNRKYEEAHCALDDIESKVHAVRRHLEKLQWLEPKGTTPKYGV